MTTNASQAPTETRTLTSIYNHKSDRTELSGGLLMAETEEGHYEPIAAVATIGEAAEIALSDFQNRNPDEDICPYEYAIWERGAYGKYTKTITLSLE